VLIINLAILLGMEGIFRVFGLFPAVRYFAESKDSEGRVWVDYRSGSGRKFPSEKPANGLRIFSFGESTTMGFPYQPATSFSRMLEYALEKSSPAKKVEVINLGASGMYSRDVYDCLRQSLKYRPDLVIIYLGQNEFFRASLFPDWKHKRLDRGLDLLRARSRIYQALRGADKLLLALPGAIGTNQELAEKLNLNLEQMPMENRPMSPRFYNDRINSFGYHLENILRLLQDHDLPAVLCTVAVNLKDWPPEWIPFPAGLTQAQAGQLKADLYRAYLDVADGKTAQAASLLEKSEPLSKNYAMYYYVLARLEEKEGKHELAAGHFEDARRLDNSRHRAPPEINRIIRELAAKYQATLVDVEKLFFESAGTTPGFDIFVDHVHPNLKAQRLIAQELYQTLLHSGLVEALDPLPEFPTTGEFEKQFALDPDFMDSVQMRLAIYYLLQRRLPDREFQTVSLLQELLARHPDSVLARVCLASLFLDQDRPEEAQQLLARGLEADPDQFRKALTRYFYPKIIMQGNYLLFHLNRDPASPLMRGILLVRSDPETAMKKPALPLGQYQWILQYQPEDHKVIEVTSNILPQLRESQSACADSRRATININQLLNKHPKDFLANQATADPAADMLELNVTGNDPWFAFPIRIMPSAAEKIRMEIAVILKDKKVELDEAAIFWTSSEAPAFSEERKVTIPVRTNGKFQVVEIPLQNNLSWLSSGQVFGLRIDPANSPGKVRIRNFKIVLCAI